MEIHLAFKYFPFEVYHYLKLKAYLFRLIQHCLEQQYQQNPKVAGSTLHKQFHRFYFHFSDQGYLKRKLDLCKMHS